MLKAGRSMNFDAETDLVGVASHARRAAAQDVKRFATEVLVAAGTDPAVAESVSSSLTETSLRGVDSHGIRLLLHYARVVTTGRINPHPQLNFAQSGPATGTVDGDHGFGHHASFFAIAKATALCSDTGIAAVSVINSSHFGSAGTYVLAAAEQGFVALGMCNSDSFVLPHDGVGPFHGTNPLAFAAPVSGHKPLLVDMATSVIPWNRVQDLMNEGLPLPPDVSVDKSGSPTTNAAESAALLPLGGIRYGYKGAALASMIEIFSAVLTGMPHCSRLLGMAGPDLSTHRRLGHFFIVIDPKRFVAVETYDWAMKAYLQDLRAQASRPGTKVMAPGDREWSVEEERSRQGIPIADQLRADLDELADQWKVKPLQFDSASQ